MGIYVAFEKYHHDFRNHITFVKKNRVKKKQMTLTHRGVHVLKGAEPLKYKNLETLHEFELNGLVCCLEGTLLLM